MLELRQSTTVVVFITGVVNSTGITPVTNLTIDGADEAELLKNGTISTLAISGTLTAIANCDGSYYLTLSVSDTNTLGQLHLVLQDDSACLPIFREYEVVTANYWDSKYSTSLRNVNIEAISGDTAASDTLETHIEGTTLFKVDLESVRGITATATDISTAHTNISTINGHITADYGATEKSAIDLLDDAVGGLADIHTDVGTVIAKTNNLPASPAAVGSSMTLADAAITSAKYDGVTAFPLTSADTIVRTGSVVEGTLTWLQSQRAILAALAGKLSGGGTVTLTFRDTTDAKNRIVATVDANGNRSAIVLDVS